MSLILDGTTGVPVTTVTGTLPVANGGTGGSTSTGTGAVVRSTSPTLTTPDLGTPTAGVLTNCTGISVASLSTASGSAPSYSARAWANFNGTGTVAIRSSANVSSITDNGTGDYTVNFTTALPNANCASVVSISLDDSSTTVNPRLWEVVNYSSSTVRITTMDVSGNLIDMAAIYYVGVN